MPLLAADESQFQSFMDLIKALSQRVEQEQTRKLQEMSSNSTIDSRNGRTDDIMSFSTPAGSNGIAEANDGDFEQLVLGKRPSGGVGADAVDVGWNSTSPRQPQNPPLKGQSETPAFSWSTLSPQTNNLPRSNGLSNGMGVVSPQTSSSRSITPEYLSGFAALKPSAGGGSGPSLSQPLQPQNQQSAVFPATQEIPSWLRTQSSMANAWNGQRTNSSPSTATLGSLSNSMSNASLSGAPLGMTGAPSAMPIPPPPSGLSQSFGMQTPSSSSAFSIMPPPRLPSSHSFGGIGSNAAPKLRSPEPSTTQKSGLDRYESLL